MANMAHRTARLCDAGLHPMDPTWEVCPYCDQGSKKELGASTNHSSTRSASGERRTSIGDAPGASSRETKTIAVGTSGSTAGVGDPGDTRKIVGVIITYTWRPEGQLFLIREGKNFIGAGNISSDAGHRACDILVPEDPKLSSEHALILYRHNRYDLVDQASSNGTFLNNELVPLQGTELPNYAEIKTGSTVWSFVKMSPPAEEIREVIPTSQQTTQVRERPKEKRKDDTIVP